jgi:GT2 family glycosyltransferase
MGIKIAMDRGADYIFLLNQDAWIEPDTVQKLVETAGLNKDYGIVSPMHLAADKNNFEDSFSEFLIHPYSNSEFLNDLYFDRLATIYQTRFINAAAWLLSRECIQTVGGFDPLFFHYEEDMNYAHRVQYHGFKIGFCPSVRICHDSANRIIEKQHLDRMYTNRLISDFLNINDKEAIYKYNKLIFNSFYKLFRSLILLKFTKVKEKFILIKFLLRNGKSVKTSRKTNMERGMHYLTERI